MKTVLVIDDNETMREGVAATVRRQGLVVETAPSGDLGLALYRARHHDLVISDLRMAGLDGLGVVEAVRHENPDAVVLIMTAYGTVETAVKAMQLGAMDFVQKPFAPEVLRLKLEAARQRVTLTRDRSRLINENEVLRRDAQSGDDTGLVGDSAEFSKILKAADRVARTDSTVLLQGESGTGKELVARLIHEHSSRPDGPFIRVNCGALSENLLESELFGHEKGAFTGALRRRIGRFELADRGTLFLDEIGDLPGSLQVKLLRVLQEREFERVGGEETLKVDVRIVAATHRDLDAMVQEGSFRQDLLYRLRVVPIRLPALRERRDDIPALVAQFVSELAARTQATATAFSPEALSAMAEYDWPGNVRELRNCVEQVLVFADGPLVGRDDLPKHLDRATGTSNASEIALDGRPLPDLLDDIERRLILQAYEECGGVKAETARRLGVKTSALYYKLEKYGIG